MNFQPVLPIPLTQQWSLVFRPVVPGMTIGSQFEALVDWEFGLGVGKI